MIAFEVALLIVLGVITVVGLRAIGEPLTKAHAEKIKYQYKELGSAAETALKTRVEYLESEVLTLKQQLKEVQESVEYAVKRSEAQSAGEKIRLTDKDLS